MKQYILLAVLACATVGNAAENSLHVRLSGRDVAVWKPTGPAPVSGYPVLLFSHGFTGCNTQSVFLMEALAQAGYLVVAPNHRDAGCGLRRRSRMRRPQQPFDDASQWSDATYQERAADVEAVLNAVLKEKQFQGVKVDASRIGLAGHSLGGYTVLGVAGGWPSWKDHRVQAVLALSPFCTPYIAKGDLSHLGVPVMYQGGTLDFGISPSVRRLDGAYDHSSTPKYYVEFNGAGHLAWTDLNKTFQDLISQYSVAFFDRYLKDVSPDRLAGLVATPPKNVSLAKGDGAVKNAAGK